VGAARVGFVGAEEPGQDLVTDTDGHGEQGGDVVDAAA
jgi:hypothetical protein